MRQALVLVLGLAALVLLPHVARADPRVTVVGAQLVPSTPLAFDSHAGTLLAEATPALDAVAAYLRAHPTLTIEVGAHTDDRGSAAYNLRVTQGLADQVRQELIARGVAPTRVRAVGYGESRPIADNLTESGRSANRRIELVVVSP